MIAAYLIDPGTRQYNLDALAQQWLGVATISIESLIGKGKTRKVSPRFPYGKRRCIQGKMR